MTTRQPVLYNACENNDIEQVKNLIELAGRNVIDLINQQDDHPNKSTCLHIASYMGHTDIVKLLLENGANRSIRNSYARTAFEIARTEEVKCIFRQINAEHSSHADDYIKWAFVCENMEDKRQFFRHITDFIKNFNPYTTHEMLYEIINYYIRGYLTNQEAMSNAQVKTIETDFSEAFQTQHIIEYVIKAYTSTTTGFFRILNEHLAKNLLSYFELNTDFNDGNFPLVRCLKNIVTLLIHHPDFVKHKFIGTTYRGMRVTEQDLAVYKTGSIIMYQTFLSTTKQQCVAEFFADAVDEGRQNALPKTPDGKLIEKSVVCEYLIRNNRTALDIEHMSNVTDEEEVLITPFSIFQVVDIKTPDPSTNSSMLIEIKLEEYGKYDSTIDTEYYFQEQTQQFLLKLKQECQHKYSMIKRLMINDEYPIDQNYINLAVIKNDKEEQRQSEQSIEFRKKLNSIGISTYEQIYGTKTPIDIKDLFEHCDKKSTTKRLLVYGRAGIGKTTFCQYVTYRWSTGKLFQQYRFVLWIRLRNLSENFYQFRSSQPYTLLDIVKQECFKTHQLDTDKEKYLLYMLKNLSSNILWLLDGYDEIQIPDHLQTVFEELMSKQHVIITSRPTATISYPNDGRFEISGFTDDNIQNYIKQFFRTQSKDDENIVAFLRSSPNVWGICHIPISLEIFCTSWSFQRTKQQNERMTITRLYSNMIEWVLRRSLSKKTSTQVVNEKGKDSVFEEYKKELKILDKIAFRCIAASNLIVESKVCQDVVKEKCGGSGRERDEWRKKVMSLGILRSLEDSSVKEEDKDYYFIHLSFQEFFAARQLKRMLQSKRDEGIKFIKQNKFNSRYQLVFIFLAGLLNRKGVDIFFELVSKEPLDIFGAKHSQLLVVCLEETDIQQHQSVLKQINQHLISIIQLEDAYESEKRFLDVLGRSCGVLFHSIIEQTILTHLNSVYRTLYCIEKMQNCSINVFNRLLYLINDKSCAREARWLVDICNNLCMLVSRSLITEYVQKELVSGDKSMENNLIRIVVISMQCDRGVWHSAEEIAEVINNFESLLSNDFKLELQKLLIAKNTTSASAILPYLNKSIRQPIADQLLSGLSDVDELKREKATEKIGLLTDISDDVFVRLIFIYIETPYETVKNTIGKIYNKCSTYHICGSLHTVKEIEKIYCEHQSDESLTTLLSKSLLFTVAEHPEYLSSLSHCTIEYITMFCRGYLTPYREGNIKYIQSMIFLMHNPSTCDKMLPFLLNMLKTGDDHQREVVVFVLKNLDENVVIKYDIIQKLLSLIDLKSCYCSSVKQILLSVCEKIKNIEVLQPLETSVLQCKDLCLKGVASTVLRSIKYLTDEILVELFEQLKTADDDTLKEIILQIFSEAPAQAARYPEIIEYCLQCIQSGKKTSHFLDTIANIWVQSPRETLLEQILNIGSDACVRSIFKYAAENASNCVILNQLLDRVNEFHCFEMFNFFCSKIQHPHLIFRLLDVVQSSETNAQVSSMIKDILFKLGTFDEYNTTDLYTIVTSQWPNNKDEDRKYRLEFNADYLLYFSDELIKYVLVRKGGYFPSKYCPLIELLRVYLLTEKQAWIDAFIYGALERSVAVIVDKKNKCVFVDENNEIKIEFVKKDKQFDNIIKKLSERKNGRYLSIDEEEEEDRSEFRMVTTYVKPPQRPIRLPVSLTNHKTYR